MTHREFVTTNISSFAYFHTYTGHFGPSLSTTLRPNCTQKAIYSWIKLSFTVLAPKRRICNYHQHFLYHQPEAEIGVVSTRNMFNFSWMLMLWDGHLQQLLDLVLSFSRVHAYHKWKNGSQEFLYSKFKIWCSLVFTDWSTKLQFTPENDRKLSEHEQLRRGFTPAWK